MRCAHLIVLCAGALVLAGCNDPVITIDGHGGVPLAKLDLSGGKAGEVTVLGPDTVNIVHGAKLGIQVGGDPRAVDALRFVLTDGKLAIARKSGVTIDKGTAIVTLTVPAVDHLIMAGSGAISSDRLDGESVGVTIGGSGQIAASGIAAKKLDVEILGTGAFSGKGRADKLDLTIAGTGSADLAGLQAGDANIDLAGTGSGTISSNGKVTGTVVGTGDVTVHGKAQCKVDVTGTGKVTCQP